MVDDRWWRGLDERLATLVEPGAGARVLDVGCSDGGLVEQLRGRGFDAFGVDPRAPEHPHLTTATVEELEVTETFDGVCAVLSLHHAALEPACEAITGLLRTDAVLLVWEFDWPAYDARAARWLAEADASASDHSVERWRAQHGDLHTGDALRDSLDRAFVIESEAHVPYLARMLGRHDLEPAERERIDANLVPALGLEYVCRLRSSRGA